MMNARPTYRFLAACTASLVLLVLLATVVRAYRHRQEPAEPRIPVRLN